jgi:molybdopterin synthase catalytic subunit
LFSLVANTWNGGFVKGAPKFERALRGLSRDDAGAVALLAPTARDVALDVTPLTGSKARFARALKAGRAQGALAGRILHGTGTIRAGQPMVVVAAAARSRQDAMMSVQTMLNALKGVALRRDASKA